MTTTYDARPWLATYPTASPRTITPEHATPLTMVRRHAVQRPDAPALHYFDATLSWAGLDAASDAVAALLVSRGFRPGDRLGLYLQNDPAFVIGLLAAWKAGGIAAALSPMSKAQELDALLRDCTPVALLALDDLYDEVAGPLLSTGEHGVHTVLTASALDGQQRSDPRTFAGTTRRDLPDTLDLYAVVGAGRPFTAGPLPDAADPAVLAYTSGTTGVPKGAMITHGNLAFNAQTYRDLIGLQPGEPILALSPVFHVTGLVGGVLLALLLGSPLVLTHRFHPRVTMDAIRERRPAYAIASVTAFLALVDEGGSVPEDFDSFRQLSTGGAPLEPEVADRLEERLGRYLHNMYGQTETTSPSHAVPAGLRAPVDEATGALSVGLPVFDTVARVVDESGDEVAAGDIGEIVTAGPQVVPGYWDNPAATAAAMPTGEFHTGDVGFMDADGWFFVVDRRNDMINAAGYKVWPREVEVVLQQHPAVREVAVVGIPDDYRGESVKAFVALRAAAEVSENELVDYCRERLAAYKYPREVELVARLPRTLTGKVLRRQLRDAR